MAEGQPILPPPPALTDEQDTTRITQNEPRPVKGRSLFDFFGKKGQSANAGTAEQNSGSASISSKDRELENQSSRTLQPDSVDAVPPDGDTSANSITIVEPTGSKRKAAPTASTSGRKRAQGKKVTDEDAELREMEAAARKKQKAVAKTAGKKGKSGAMDIDGGIKENAVGETRRRDSQKLRLLMLYLAAGPSTVPPPEHKKRGPRKQSVPPQGLAHEIIDISSPVKLKASSIKRGPGSKAKNKPRIHEDVDFTVTEEEDEVSVVGHSRTGSQSSLHLGPRQGRNRVRGTYSAESMGSEGDAIHIDDDDLPAVTTATAPKRKKPHSLTAGKPMHSFFNKPKPAATDVDQPPASNNHNMSIPLPTSGSQEVANSGNLPTQNTSTTAKPTYDFFSVKTKRASQVSAPSYPIETSNPFSTSTPKATIGRSGWAQTATTVKEPRWPTAEEIEEPSEYVGERPRLELPKRARQRVEVVPKDESFWSRLLPRAVVDLDAEESVNAVQMEAAAIPEDYADHPAITSLAAKAANGTKTQLWIDKYRPLNHTEVLGNEVPAKYLVDWLAELAIGIHGEVSEEKRKVQRKVIKTRRRQARADDWIVEDDEPIRDDREEDDAPVDDAESAQQTGYPDLRRQRLTNSILLQGPCGSGKTASVYAAAAELGWEVFEVYPGIGKRSGAHLTQLVGDVGKNHLVGKGRQAMPPSPAPGKKSNPLLQAFGKLAGNGKPAESKVHAVDLTDSPGRKPQTEMDFGFVAQTAHTRDVKSGGPDVRQSLILLEEVDILFEEDKGFWPAVVSLVEESKRPVIMTCNGKQGLPVELVC